MRFHVPYIDVSMLIILQLSEEAIKVSTEKIKGYAAGYGAVMFFEDQAPIDSIAAKMPAYVECL